jgi:hypothetical protein
MYLNLIAGRGAFRPARFDIRDVERVWEIATGVATIMRDQINLGEALTVFIPLCLGAHPNLTLEQSVGLGATALDSEAAGRGHSVGAVDRSSPG